LEYLITQFTNFNINNLSENEILNNYIEFLHSLVLGKKYENIDIGTMCFEEMCDIGFIKYEIIMMFINRFRHATFKQKNDEYDSIVDLYEFHRNLGI
jgi:hypothetical protein